MTGVDFSARVIGLCQKNYDVDGLSFVHGDAEDLPFDDESFDAVLNVESSHCYGSLSTFFAEVLRVLRPGGHFLFADLRHDERCDELKRQLADTGMTIVDYENITPNVLAALRRDSEQKSADIKESLGAGADTVREFAALEGSETFESFANGSLQYFRYVLRK